MISILTGLEKKFFKLQKMLSYNEVIFGMNGSSKNKVISIQNGEIQHHLTPLFSFGDCSKITNPINIKDM